MSAAARGDSSAWDELVDRFGRLVWSVARAQGLNDPDAADVSQTTWLRFAEHLGRLRDPDRAGWWLATTARREAIRVGQMGCRQVLVEPWTELETEDDVAHAELLEKERDLSVQQAVALLPERCRRLLLALIGDPPQSYAEISATLGMPVGSIGPTRGRCLEHLRELLAQVEMGRVVGADAGQG